jgi:hypothetical protein
MNESLNEMQTLIQEISEHLRCGTKGDARRAASKLDRIAAIASTSALTLHLRR